MKNFIFKLTAIALSALMLAGCSNKKTESVPEPDTPDEPAIEQPFVEFDESDFYTIEVPVSVTEEPAPMEIKSKVFVDISFGEKLPPCKTEENYKDYMPDHIKEGTYIYDEYMENVGKPDKGDLIGNFRDGKYLYMEVEYDRYCSGNHEWSLFRYDLETEEMEEIYTYSGLDDEIYYPHDVKDGKIYMRHGDVLYSCDADTLEESPIYTFDSENSSYKITGDGKLFIEKRKQNGDEEISEICIFDIESGEETALCSVNADALRGYICSDAFAYFKKPEDSRNLDIVTDFYSIRTTVTGGQILYASQDKVTFIANDALHTYNLEKMEHYVTDTSNYGNQFTVYDGNVVMGYRGIAEGASYYFLQETGLAFKLNAPEKYEDDHSVNRTTVVMFGDGTCNSASSFNSENATYELRLYWIE